MCLELKDGRTTITRRDHTINYKFTNLLEDGIDQLDHNIREWGTKKEHRRMKTLLTKTTKRNGRQRDKKRGEGYWIV